MNLHDTTVNPTERIFEYLDERGPRSADPETYEGRVQDIIADAVNFEESYLSRRREIDTRYYKGQVPDIDHVMPAAYDSMDATPEVDDENDGRSTFVSTDARDTVMAILPSLIRIFTSAENVVFFAPNTSEQTEMAAQATDYIQYVFWEDNDGFLLLHNTFKDALINAMGVLKWWTDIDHEISVQQFSNITQDGLALLMQENPEGEIEDIVFDPESPEIIQSLRFKFKKSKPVHRIASVPPEEFRISSNAKSVQDARLVGHERLLSVSDVVKMGVPYEVAMNFVEDGTWHSDERFLRNPGLVDNASMNDGVVVGDWFIRVDQDGDGIDELRFIRTIGSSERFIIEDEAVPCARFALFGPDPEPHTAIGSSMVDNVRDIQRIKTNMLRAALDNLANAVVPRTVVNETITNVNDALNMEQNAVIRTRGDVGSAVASLLTPFVGKEVFGMVDQVNRVRDARTGITEASKGLDPKALQSTTVSGVDAIVSGAQERIELIARILAETGFRDLMKGLLKEVINNPNPDRTIQLRGKWVQVNPSTFDPDLRVKVNPTLGKGSDITRLMALQEVRGMQVEIITKYGLDNPVCGIPEVYNTISDILALNNIKNVNRYFKEVDEATLQAIAAQPKEPDAAVLLAQAELEKVRASTVKDIATKNFDYDKLRMDDDFRRDKMEIDAVVDAMGIFAKFPAAPEPGIEGRNTPVPLRE